MTDERHAREQRIIGATPAPPPTRRSLAADLRALGVAHGDVLAVHSSLASIGWVVGGAMALIEALFEAIGPDGTLAMPAHSSVWTDPAHWENPPVPPSWVPVIREEWPAFDPARTPTDHLGVVPELFRTWPGTRRSSHPNQSWCAHGPAAEAIVAHHPLEAGFGPDSPLGRLESLGARVLLLGVDHSSNTSLHLAEHRAAARQTHREGAAMIVAGRRRWVEYDALEYDSSCFALIGAGFEADHPDDVQLGAVGSAPARLMRMRGIVAFGESWFRARRQEDEA